jgi:SAM-dependent methyltransferase
MAKCIATYMPAGRSYRVADFGSRISDGQQATHRELLADHDIEYIGIDLDAGRNVDVVMTQPYRVPLRSNSVDIVMSGQVFEHIPFFWASFMELARIVKPGGYIFLTVPSRGHTHDVYDCWRYYPDGLRALAACARLELKEGRTAFPPTSDGRRHDYAAIDVANAYWGDTSASSASRPTIRPPRYGSSARWPSGGANRVGDLSHVPATYRRERGRRLEPPAPVKPAC